MATDNLLCLFLLLASIKTNQVFTNTKSMLLSAPMLTFEDLKDPAEKEESKRQAMKERMEKEKPYVIDAIVRRANADFFLNPIYKFRDYFDMTRVEGPMFQMWSEWLNEIRQQHPSLPAMRIHVPPYHDGGGPDQLPTIRL